MREEDKKKDYVYGKRSKFKILKNKYKFYFIYYIIKIYSKILKIESDVKPLKDYLIYPKMKNKNDLNDILNKLFWALNPTLETTIYVYVDKKLIKNIDNFYAPESQRNYILNKDRVKLVSEKKELKKVLKRCRKIVLWNDIGVIKLALIRKLDRVILADKKLYSSYESTVWYKLKYNSLNERKKRYYKELSINNFNKLIKKYKKINKSYIFVTGPSFDNYKNYIFEKDSFKIICNTIVKNKEFLKYINGPDLITFADPAFHFSSNEYAAKFRDEVIEVSKKYNSSIMIPLFTLPLILSHYPELEENIIGVEIKNNGINFPTIDNFWVQSSGSIITYMMIPMASALTNNVYILGADGRDKNESYFWKHNKSVQFHDLMNTVFETHPSFFRDRDYLSHYDAHVEYLTKMIEFGEKKGIKYFSLSDSFVPALHNRLIERT